LLKVLFLDTDEERLEVLKAGEDNETPQSIELCRALLAPKTNWSTLAKLLKAIDMSDAEKVRQGVMGYMNAVLLNGKASAQAVSAMQAFSSADTYKNGKNAILVACLDYLDMLGD